LNNEPPELRRSPRIKATNARPITTATNTPARFLSFSNVAI